MNLQSKNIWDKQLKEIKRNPEVEDLKEALMSIALKDDNSADISFYLFDVISSLSGRIKGLELHESDVTDSIGFCFYTQDRISIQKLHNEFLVVVTNSKEKNGFEQMFLVCF